MQGRESPHADLTPTCPASRYLSGAADQRGRRGSGAGFATAFCGSGFAGDIVAAAAFAAADVVAAAVFAGDIVAAAGFAADIVASAAFAADDAVAAASFAADVVAAAVFAADGAAAAAFAADDVVPAAGFAHDRVTAASFAADAAFDADVVEAASFAADAVAAAAFDADVVEAAAFAEDIVTAAAFAGDIVAGASFAGSAVTGDHLAADELGDIGEPAAGVDFACDGAAVAGVDVACAADVVGWACGVARGARARGIACTSSPVGRGRFTPLAAPDFAPDSASDDRFIISRMLGSFCGAPATRAPGGGGGFVGARVRAGTGSSARTSRGSMRRHVTTDESVERSRDTDGISKSSTISAPSSRDSSESF